MLLQDSCALAKNRPFSGIRERYRSAHKRIKAMEFFSCIHVELFQDDRYIMRLLSLPVTEIIHSGPCDKIMICQFAHYPEKNLEFVYPFSSDLPCSSSIERCGKHLQLNKMHSHEKVRLLLSPRENSKPMGTSTFPQINSKLEESAVRQNCV